MKYKIPQGKKGVTYNVCVRLKKSLSRNLMIENPIVSQDTEACKHLILLYLRFCLFVSKGIYQSIWLICVYRASCDWSNNDACKQNIIFTGQEEAIGLNTLIKPNRFFFHKERMERRQKETGSHFRGVEATLSNTKKKQMHMMMMS